MTFREEKKWEEGGVATKERGVQQRGCSEGEEGEGEREE